MRPSSLPATPENLLEHDAFLRSLARGLVGEASGADDVVQQAYVTALERPAALEGGALRAWLGGIVRRVAWRRHRSAERRARHERAAAPPDPVPSVAEIVAHEEARRRVVAAVLALDEPARSTVLLRYFRQMGPGEIARHFGVPVETVRTRIKRALERLRSELDRASPGGRTQWLAALLPVTVQRGSAGVAAAAGAALVRALGGVMGAGVLAMSLKAKVVAAVVLVGGLAATFALLQSSRVGEGRIERGGRDHSPAALAGPAAVAAVEPLAPPAGARVAEREPTAGPGTLRPDHGRIEVTAHWRSDGAPAVRQAIEVVVPGVQLAGFEPWCGFTDETGSCAIESIPAGIATLFASTGHHQQVAIDGGRTTVVALELEAWSRVRGLVVDGDGTPVADAEVWVSRPTRYGMAGRPERPGRGQHGGFALRSDASGRFETRLARVQGLSASKPGYGPSRLVFPCREDAPHNGVEVRLVLAREGSALVAEVFDAEGAPVADAHVLVGHEVPLMLDPIDGSSTPPARRGRTDARGAVELAGLAVGRLPVQVRAAGFAPWGGEVDLPQAGTARLALRLDRAASVAGIATDELGQPIAGALVYQGALESLAASSCRTDAGGRFELTSLPVGSLDLAAWHEQHGGCSTTLVGHAGVTSAWHPLLTKQPAITGTVLGSDGQPSAGAYVACSNDRGSGAATATSDERGRFTLGPLPPDGTFSVTAEVVHPTQGALRATQRGVPARSEIVLSIGGGAERTATVRGRLLEADGSPALRIHVAATREGESVASFVLVEADGGFTTGAVQPGRLRLDVVRAGSVFAELGEHELLPHTVVDLGAVVLPRSGAAAVRVGGAKLRDAVVDLSRDGRLVASRPFDGVELLWDALAPGDYVACVRGRDRGPVTGACPFTVIGGATARVAVPIAAAHRCTLDIRAEGPCLRAGTLTATSPRGVVEFCLAVERPPEGEVLDLFLPAGEFDLVFATAEGRSGTVHAILPAERVLQIVLRK